MLPLFVQPVDSNDSLYGGDSKFLAENSKLCEVVMAQILEHLKILARDEVGTCLLHTRFGGGSAGPEHYRGQEHRRAHSAPLWKGNKSG